MFKTIDEVYEFLFNRKVSLKKDKNSFKTLMASLNHPYLKLKCIHIGGTNGKGSTTNYLRSILQTAGYKVGTFTSPHLMKYNDRMRINNVWISDKQLLIYVNKYYDLWIEYDLSMFEINMFISIYYFLENDVDFVLYEVGIGGRKDTTNIISSFLSLITNIGFDHVEILGHTYQEIAYEKVGIVKENSFLLTTETKAICLDVFEVEVSKVHATMQQLKPTHIKLNNNDIIFKLDKEKYRLKSSAFYQAQNAALAMAAAHWLKDQAMISFQEEDLKEAVYNTYWPGRFEQISTDPLIILDGAHNIHGMQRLVYELRHLPKPIYAVFSALTDKDYSLLLDLLTTHTNEVIVSEFDYPRALEAEELAKGHVVTIIKDYNEALAYALEKLKAESNKTGCIIITGSLYFISEMRTNLIKE